MIMSDPAFVEDPRECQDCRHARHLWDGWICHANLMSISPTMHVTYAVAKGSCWEPKEKGKDSAMQRLAPQLVVRHKDTGKIGTTCPDLDGMLACCLETETPVVWEHCFAFQGTPTEKLDVLREEKATPDPDRCGAGRLADCCKFLVADGNGFHCERHGNLRHTIIFRQMTAKREPTALYPQCFLER